MFKKPLPQWLSVSLTRSLTIFLILIALTFSAVAVSPQTVFAAPLSAAFTDCASQSEIPATECNALVALYNNTNGANWTLNTGWLQTDTPCAWYGVHCSGGNVIALMLPRNNLSGAIPSELRALTKLQRLDLYGNNQLTAVHSLIFF